MATVPEEILEAELVFREQADGRKVARLPGGKVVLVKREDLDRVGDGERWRVKLRHWETFAIADLVERCGEWSNSVIPAALADTVLPTVAAERPAPAATPAGEVARETPGPAPGGRLANAQPGAAVGSWGASRLTPVGPLTVGDEVALALESYIAPDPRQVVRPTDRVALFVDGANMDGACRRAGYFVDYRKAREFFLAGAIFNAAYYYVADFTASDPLQQRFLDFLAHAGYIVRRRPVKVFKDEETGEQVIKGNLDTEIVLDMLNTVDNYDVAFLFSGDSDFERAVDLLRSRGKRIYVVTSSRQLSRELMYVADKPIFLLEACRDALMRDDRVMPRQSG